MRQPIVMPALVAGQESGYVIAWLKDDGEQVSKGEELMQVETEKAVVTIEAPHSGRLVIVAEIDAEVPVGDVVGYLDDVG